MGSGQGSEERQEHRVTFLDPLALTFADPDHSLEEDREITIGRSAAQRVLFVAHVAREGRVRIISARGATRREQRQYEEAIDETI